MSSKTSRRLKVLRKHLTSAASLGVRPEEQERYDQTLERYANERDARINRRPEGLDQYQRLVDLAPTDARFGAMLEDPWCTVIPRSPKLDFVEVCIIGAGYGGLCAGARLVQQGVPSSSIRLIDSAGDVGGTW